MGGGWGCVEVGARCVRPPPVAHRVGTRLRPECGDTVGVGSGSPPGCHGWLVPSQGRKGAPPEDLTFHRLR